MADPNESERDGSRAHDARLPEIVDAEVVDNVRPSDPPPQAPAEDEEYQEFLEWRRFKELRRQHGDQAAPPVPGAPAGTAADASAPWWKRLLRLLRYKFVRRLIYLFVFVLVCWWLLGALTSSFFGTNDKAEYQPGDPPPPAPQPILQSAPREAIIAVYDWVATKPGSACSLFNEPARAAFARDNAAPDCDSAVRKLNKQVTSPTTFKNPDFGEDAVQILGTDAVVHGCQVSVRGGPNLGDFGLRKQTDGGWLIDSHEPAECGP